MLKCLEKGRNIRSIKMILFGWKSWLHIVPLKFTCANILALSKKTAVYVYTRP